MLCGDYLCLTGILIVCEASRPPFAQALEQLSSPCPWLAISGQQNSASSECEKKKKHHKDCFETLIYQQGSLQTALSEKEYTEITNTLLGMASSDRGTGKYLKDCSSI